MTLNEYRQLLGLSNKELAGQLGLHESVVCNYLKKHNVPQLATALRIRERTGGKVDVTDWL